MGKKGLLVNYSNCDGCGKCVAACLASHGYAPENSGLKISVSGPFQFPSGRTEAYSIATPTDFCDLCADKDSPACTAACPRACLTVGDIDALGERMTEKKMALFTLRD